MTSQARDRDQRFRRDAENAFAQHKIVQASPDRWLIAREYADGKGFMSDLSAHITSLGRHLVVVGDVDAVVFSYGPDVARQAVAWIGNATCSRYIASKASVGMTNVGVYEWDADVAADDLREAMDGHEGDEDAIAVLEEAIEACEEGADGDTIHNMLASVPDLTESMPDLVISQRVYYAWAAVKRLHHLLLEKEKGL